MVLSIEGQKALDGRSRRLASSWSLPDTLELYITGVERDRLHGLTPSHQSGSCKSGIRWNHHRLLPSTCGSPLPEHKEISTRLSPCSVRGSLDFGHKAEIRLPSLSSSLQRLVAVASGRVFSYKLTSTSLRSRRGHNTRSSDPANPVTLLIASEVEYKCIIYCPNHSSGHAVDARSG